MEKPWHTLFGRGTFADPACKGTFSHRINIRGRKNVHPLAAKTHSFWFFHNIHKHRFHCPVDENFLVFPDFLAVAKRFFRQNPQTFPHPFFGDFFPVRACCYLYIIPWNGHLGKDYLHFLIPAAENLFAADMHSFVGGSAPQALSWERCPQTPGRGMIPLHPTVLVIVDCLRTK